MEEPIPTARALAEWALGCAEAGDRERVRRLIDEADPFPAVRLRLTLTRAALVNGDPVRAQALLDSAEALAARFVVPTQPTAVLPNLLREHACCGRGARADQAASAGRDPDLQMHCLAAVAAGIRGP
ncbi:hypothetical protein [Streptomyces tricolor]|uniref:hypothetical protein n=1 Tax=Streptomyces tricolor TaxID=68277 RepID=UPI003D731BBD